MKHIMHGAFQPTPKREEREEIDEGLIECYKETRSLPFELGEHGRIAVKIVDDRGIESLKVIDVEKPK